MTAHKQTHVSVNGQQTQTECSSLWREIKKGKEDVATKPAAQKLMLQSKVNAQKPRKALIMNLFTKKSSTKKGELFNNVIITPNYS